MVLQHMGKHMLIDAQKSGESEDILKLESLLFFYKSMLK